MEWDPKIVIHAQIEDTLNPNIKNVLKTMNIHTPDKLRGSRFDPLPILDIFSRPTNIQHIPATFPH